MVDIEHSGPERKHAVRGGVSVVVPVFQEAENIEALVQALDSALTPAGLDWELLLVDDWSKDGSREIARNLERRFPVRFETHRSRQRDLSDSVLQGLQSARHRRIVVMDADLSHPPARIPELLSELREGVMVVGSRYAPGGSLDPGWSSWRRLVSRCATLLAAPLTTCTDPMAGFFAVDRRDLPEFGALRPIGYKIGLELLVRGNFAVREVPIGFRDRRQGFSKLNWEQQLKFLRHLGRLYRFRFPLPSRLCCFGLVGASGFVIDVACWQGLQWLGLDHRWARFLSFWPAVTWNWRWNRAITFEDRPRAPRARQWMQFIAASLVGLLANVGTYVALTGAFGFFDDRRLLAMLAGVLTGMAANFAVADRFVFSQRWANGRETIASGQQERV